MARQGVACRALTTLNVGILLLLAWLDKCIATTTVASPPESTHRRHAESILHSIIETELIYPKLLNYDASNNRIVWSPLVVCMSYYSLSEDHHAGASTER